MFNISDDDGKHDYITVLPDGGESQPLPTWKTYLYTLQLQAPKPKRIYCNREVQGKPSFYGKEYHGNISRDEADQLLSEGSGSYLVRKSERAQDAYTLAIRFDDQTKNFKLFYDGQHYVGEKKFDTVHDLVNVEEDVDETLQDLKDVEKAHVFKQQNFIGLHWCDFCANFMWGLIAQGVKCQDCGFEAHKKCSEKVPNDCMPDIKFVKNIFGADLTTVVKAHSTPIPTVVEKCIKEIESRGLDSEGLYRIAGLHDEVESIRMSFDKDGERADISTAKYDDINSITSVLKLYFRLLPIPVITFEAYNIILDAIKMDASRPKEQLAKIKEGLQKLPPAHYQTLRYLIGHLSRVTEQKSKNMMGSDNLAIVFAPTLMRSPINDPMVSLMNAQFEQKFIEQLIVKYREIFSKVSSQQSIDLSKAETLRVVDRV
ncbi:hypothetical protein KUTeg_004676 [Tegillarca granosa]|uniref:N-chimaerin n=1 Tax=Tegillarca granosa TaxID=220873 RepID=A0ABQ9FNN9_TEGGR|nr:hypothetical protein KUTeg_004676 [Tegillarca granosa]